MGNGFSALRRSKRSGMASTTSRRARRVDRHRWGITTRNLQPNSSDESEPKMATDETIARVITALLSAWNRKAIDGVYDAYSMALGDLDDALVMQVVAKIIRAGGDHPPSAGDVRKVCLGATQQDHEAEAIAAFERADRHARSRGLDGSVRDLGCPLTTHAIGMLGGWAAFCGRPDEWQKRNFVKAYTEAKASPEIEQAAIAAHDVKQLPAAGSLGVGPLLRTLPQPLAERRA